MHDRSWMIRGRSGPSVLLREVGYLSTSTIAMSTSWALACVDQFPEEFNGVKAEWLKESYRCHKTHQMYYDCTLCSKGATEAHITKESHMKWVIPDPNKNRSSLDLY